MSVSPSQKYALSQQVALIKTAPRVSPSAALADFPPIIAAILARRGVSHPRQIDPDLKKLPPPEGWPGLEDAALVLAEAIFSQQRIVIVGDFDADGATASALSKLALDAMGAAEVVVVIPDRQKHGYGLSPQLLADHPVGPGDVILTVDNGIAAFSGVAAAHDSGAKVVITDHHLPAETWPDAAAVANPNLPDVRFAGHNLAGVGVAFYVLARLRTILVQRGWFNSKAPAPNLARYLDLVALGTIADVVKLDELNRRLVAQGLACIRQGRGQVGVLALFAVAGRDYRKARAADLGFIVGPRLNAAGRLAHMDQGVNCLMASTPEKARQLAIELDRTNRQRQDIEQGMLNQALEQVRLLAGQPRPEQPQDWVRFDPQFHPGVVGLLAGRLKSRWLRPVFVFAPECPGDTGTMLKGSGRSIDGLHLRDLLVWIDQRAPGMIAGFGGHAMAAGLTLPHAQLERFRALFAEAVDQVDIHWPQRDVVQVEGALDPAELSLEFYDALEAIGPFGTGFEQPVFANHFQVLEKKPIKGGKHYRLTVAHPENPGGRLTAIWFNAPQILPPGNRWVIAYRLDCNIFRGRAQLQLVVSTALPAE